MAWSWDKNHHQYESTPGTTLHFYAKEISPTGAIVSEFDIDIDSLAELIAKKINRSHKSTRTKAKVTA